MSDLTTADDFALESATKDGSDKDYTISRWSKKGDRLYLNDDSKLDKHSVYVDLETGSVEGVPSSSWSTDVSVEGDTLTVTVEYGKVRTKTKEFVVAVTGEAFDADGDEDTDADEDGDGPEVVTDGGEDVTDHVSDETIETAIKNHDGPLDHPETATVEEVRDALAWLQEGAEEMWSEWMDNVEHGETRVVHEDRETIVFATGQQSIPRRDLREFYPEELGERVPEIANAIHHELARERCDYDWGTEYPVVVRKPESFDAGQQYVEAVVNGLQRNHGLSPGQAWAYYGVEIRGNSMSSWGKRKGDHDHKNVSDALEKARRKVTL